MWMWHQSQQWPQKELGLNCCCVFISTSLLKAIEQSTVHCGLFISFLTKRHLFLTPNELYFGGWIYFKTTIWNCWHLSTFHLLLSDSQLIRSGGSFPEQVHFNSYRIRFSRKPLFYKLVRKMVRLVNISRLVKFQNFLKLLLNKISKEKCSLFSVISSKIKLSL